jgi:hypothetical protein
MGNKMITIIAALTLLILSGSLFQLFGRYLYNYYIEEDSIKVILSGRVTLGHIPFSSVQEIRKVSFKEALLPNGLAGFLALRIGNRVWGEILLIRRKKGIFKNILITPNSSDEFVQNFLRYKNSTERRVEEMA